MALSTSGMASVTHMSVCLRICMHALLQPVKVQADSPAANQFSPETCLLNVSPINCLFFLVCKNRELGLGVGGGGGF